jgi:hypothetical protein
MAGSIMAGQTTNYLFDYPTSTDYVKDGATAIQTLATDVDTTLYTALGFNYPGMRLVKKQTVGTGVSSVNVTGAFSATYENYRLIYSGGVTVGSQTNIALKLGASTSGYRGFLTYMGYTVNTINGLAENAASSFSQPGGGNPNGAWLSCDLFGLFLAKWTRLQNGLYSVDNNTGKYEGIHEVATSYTDFTLIPGGGVTLTGGTIYVYGYGIS